MNKEELNNVLKLHKKWLNNEEGGQRADLQGADLQGADLQGANLKRADLQGADLQGANLKRADLQGADLQYANLKRADLQGADLDFSCLPLWCGGLNFKIDERQVKQLMYHVINLMQYSELNVSKIVKKEMFNWLRDSHLVTEHNLPILEEK